MTATVEPTRAAVSELAPAAAPADLERTPYAA